MKRKLYFAILICITLPFAYSQDTTALMANLAEINQAITLSSQDDPTLYLERARILRELGRYEEAADDYSYLIVIDPGRYGYYCYLRAVVFNGMKKYHEALDDINKAIEYDSENVLYYFWRGISYAQMDMNQEALVDYTRAIALSPPSFHAYGRRGLVYFKLKKYQDAIDDFNKAIELNPDYYNYYVERGGVYFDIKKYDEAMADYDRALSKAPPNSLPKIYCLKAMVYMVKGKYRDAYRDVNRAIECDPRYANAYLSRATIYEAQAELAKRKSNKTKFQKLAKEDYATAERLGYVSE